ncbi:unnamed protein product [Rotaria sp. Silwood2]|nr:unnamed protein product [Rotaria sp. Silwood2]CAF3001361.1 unnamed protein product [Rotaria sp. Silwood2]CAF3355315.1 unnamed protein product [Rotaria sp. Silwood2]CAF4311740.1 unnamed protein product [Rotaria sp. Silwood2]CAF4350928.1 unnamed protein product [Rotaria sp. Silwood2]
MHRIFRSKKTHHSNENNDIENNCPKRLYSRHKSLSHVVPIPMIILPQDKTNIRIVRIRLIFIHIGEIDTLNEKYQADIYYEARWFEIMSVKSLDLDIQQRSQLLDENISIRLNDLNPKNYWTPQLFIENEIGQIGKQDTWFTIKKFVTGNFEPLSPSAIRLEICEHRRIRGVFWEKLELNHFPADVQDLTVSISTIHHVENCLLVPDEQLRSSINREAFFDQQEWKLYEHVATESRQTKEEYSFENDNSGIEQKKHPVLAFTCRAARRPGYYYWNGFCLIFLITVCSFCIFSIPPDLPQSRLQITCTLLLTSVTFRWVVNRSLPTISYLTTLDKYAIISIIMLVLLCVWHSVIATLIFLNPTKASLTRTIVPTHIYVNIDRYVFICLFSIYTIIHILLIIWLIFVPYKRRREMEYLDREYAAKKHIQLETTRTRFSSIQSQPQDLVFRRASSVHGNIPIIKSPIRPIKHPDGITIISNTTTFLPIKEETNETKTKILNTIELNEEDDVFCDHTNDTNNELKTT